LWQQRATSPNIFEAVWTWRVSAALDKKIKKHIVDLLEVLLIAMVEEVDTFNSTKIWVFRRMFVE
jgi:hypothetical protein